MKMSPKAELVLGAVGDASVVIIIGISSILIRQLATPYHRGFFQDDESLMYPYKSSTVPSALLYAVAFSLNSIAILVTEGVLLKLRERQEEGGGEKGGGSVGAWLWTVYRLGLLFFFGVVVTHFSTNVPKYTIGRLRPHFFAVCAPDLSQLNSTQGYIDTDICTGPDTARIKEARVSFPSGHSSMAVYCSLFLVLYLERRMTWRGLLLLKPLVQVLVGLAGGYVCLSRIADHKHHWSDVLAGALLGALVAVFVFVSVERSVLGQRSGSGSEASRDAATAVSTTMQSRHFPLHSSPARHSESTVQPRHSPLPSGAGNYSESTVQPRHFPLHSGTGNYSESTMQPRHSPLHSGAGNHSESITL